MKTHEFVELLQREFILRRDPRIVCRFEALLEEHYVSRPCYQLATRISFMEITMNPTQAGQTQVFTGTLSPAGSVLAPDAVATIASNDPAVSPTLDSTQLIVSVTYPEGWTESTTTPLVFTYATTSASTDQALSATITPSAPVVLATGIGFKQTT
jgi:hypothetical protein